MHEGMHPLASGLYSEITPDFFRVLSGGNARIYTDALDALEREMGGAGLSRQEAVEIVTQIVERHAGFREEDAPAEDMQSPRGQANFLLNRLLQT